MIANRLSQTFIFVVLSLIAEIPIAISSNTSRYSPVLRNTYSNICPRPEFVNGIIRIRLRGKYLRFECYDGFTLVGSKLILCKNGRWNSPAPICVKSGCSDLPPVDKGFIFYENDKAAATLFCDSGYKLAGSMYNYCNGSSWDRSLGSCRPTGSAVAVSCDFEVDDLCGWENEATHSVDWERSAGVVSRRDLKTGPKHDHTTGEPLNGHFMMVDSSQQNMDATSSLLSPIYSKNYSSAHASFRFFYHMFGDVGTLDVYVKPLSLSLREMLKQTAPFTVSGNQGNAWIEGCLDVAQQSESFQIVVQGSLGMRYKSDIAIDDVQLISDSSCNSSESISPPVTESDDDIFRIDSCAGRCGKHISDYPSGMEQGSIHCGCNSECNDDGPCCPDYTELCVFDQDEEDVVDLPPFVRPTVSFSDPNYQNRLTLESAISNPIYLDEPKTDVLHFGSMALGVLGTILLIASIVMSVICFSQSSRYQLSSMIRKWRSNQPDDTLQVVEDVQYLAVNDSISNASEDLGSVVSLQSP